MLIIDEVGDIHNRIDQLVDHFCKGNKAAFGRGADIQSGVLAGIIGGRKNKPSFDVLQKLLTAYPSVAPTWLLFGRGPMLKEDSLPVIPRAPAQERDPNWISEELAQHLVGIAIDKSGGLELFVRYYLESLKPGLSAEVAKANGFQVQDIDYRHRTYHLGEEPTAIAGYDDRLTTRLKPLTKDSLLKLMSKPVEEGGLHNKEFDGVYFVTEEAIREWEGSSVVKS